MNRTKFIFASFYVLTACVTANAQAPATQRTPPVFGTHLLTEIRMRDVCILVDEKTKTYYAVSSGSAPAKDGLRSSTVRVYTSQDLLNWTGPATVFQTPINMWGDTNITGIWAPEMHLYKGKYYLFLTFNTDAQFPEQWRDWLPRVKRGSQVLVSDSILGPFKPFEAHSTLPVDMMTLDGTLWVEDGVPYMVFAHEWVQIKDGTVEFIRLKDDLSATSGEPKRLFNGSDAPWSRKNESYGCTVTDGPFLHRSKSGKLFMLWSSFSTGGYTTGVAISDSGKLAGPWRQQAEPIYAADGGHPMLFNRLDGQLMMVLHSPNKEMERGRIFEMDDTGETLRLKNATPK
ncbi:MAG: glycoside hydrolase family 43 protein [Pyrinomonadaceae bacterium]